MSMHPTARGWTLGALALVLYFFANQTQVGWLYVLAAIAAGVWLAAALIPRPTLRALSLVRRLNGSAQPVELELYAGDTVTVELELRNATRTPAWQVRGVETCPLAPDQDRALPFFAPAVPPQASVNLRYETKCARRGWFEFPPVAVSTRAPFGFFSARRNVDCATAVLVFPECRDLERLTLFDRTPARQHAFARLGLSGEFVGVREYRPGDPRRHVHWRSTARAGQLIVKEFAEETRPGLTLALDLRAASVVGAGEANSLELAIKIAASLARCADRRGLPVTLATNSRRWPAPAGPLSWWGLMNYLARVEADGDQGFADTLAGLVATTCVAAVLAAPDEAAVAPLIELRSAGLGVLAVVIDATPFLPDGWGETGGAHSMAAALAAGGVSVRVIGAEPDWERTLSDEDTQLPGNSV